MHNVARWLANTLEKSNACSRIPVRKVRIYCKYCYTEMAEDILVCSLNILFIMSLYFSLRVRVKGKSFTFLKFLLSGMVYACIFYSRWKYFQFPLHHFSITWTSDHIRSGIALTVWVNWMSALIISR